VRCALCQALCLISMGVGRAVAISTPARMNKHISVRCAYIGAVLDQHGSGTCCCGNFKIPTTNTNTQKQTHFRALCPVPGAVLDQHGSGTCCSNFDTNTHEQTHFCALCLYRRCA
jgi:hypothetical protein